MVNCKLSMVNEKRRAEKRRNVDVIPAKAGISLTIKELVILNEVKNPSSIS